MDDEGKARILSLNEQYVEQSVNTRVLGNMPEDMYMHDDDRTGITRRELLAIVTKTKNHPADMREMLSQPKAIETIS
jgi:hypothetical protein